MGEGRVMQEQLPSNYLPFCASRYKAIPPSGFLLRSNSYIHAVVAKKNGPPELGGPFFYEAITYASDYKLQILRYKPEM